MKLTCKTNDYVIFDDVFDEHVFQSLWKWFNSLEFNYVNSNQWKKIWKISDGSVLMSKGVNHKDAPFNSPMDYIHKTILFLVKDQLVDLLGEEGKDWSDISLTGYVYPKDTRISYHNDYGHFFACIFYIHPEWDCQWGGELQIAQTPKLEDVEIDVQPNMINRPHINKIINHFGFGAYIVPKPNRLVFTRGQVWHQISRVDSSAGDHSRCSIVGFFKKN